MESVPAELSSTNLSPLIHQDKDGELLKRAPDVDVQIHDALILAPADLVKLAEKNAQDAEFLKDEALVYLIRAFHKSGNKDITNQLSEILIRRWTPFIYSKFNGFVDADDAFCAVIKILFTHILFRDDGRGDFLQVKFGLHLKRIIVSVFRIHHDKKEKESSTFTFSELSNEEDEDMDWDETTESDELSPEDKVFIDEAADVLTGDLQKVYILRHKYNFQIESIDPDEPTLSKYFGKTPRTIRNWLKQADEILKKWQGENHE